MATLDKQNKKTSAGLRKIKAYRTFGSEDLADLISRSQGKASSDGTKLEKDLHNEIDLNYQIPNGTKTFKEALNAFNAKKSDFGVARHLRYTEDTEALAGDLVIFTRLKSGLVHVTVVELKAQGPLDRTKINGEIEELRGVTVSIQKQHPGITADAKMVSWETKLRSGIAATFSLSLLHKDGITNDEVWSGKEFATELRIGDYDVVHKKLNVQYELETQINREFAYEKIVEAACKLNEPDIVWKKMKDRAIKDGNLDEFRDYVNK